MEFDPLSGTIEQLPPELLALLGDSEIRFAAVFLIGAIALSILRKIGQREQTKGKAKPPKPRHLWRWPWHRKRIPWKLGSETIDLVGGQDTQHAIVAGATRSGKSSALLPLLTLPGPVVAVGFDVSKPLNDWWVAHADDKTYIRWRMDGTLGWNILDGPALSVSEGLTAGFARSQGDRGIYRGHVSTRLLRLIRIDDDAGRERDLRRYIVELKNPTGDREADTACKDWSARFDSLLERFGPAFGNDFSLASAVKNGQKVLALPNRFLHPESAMLIGGIGLVQSRRVAGEIGGFLQFIEEAGQASYYTEEINAAFQAGGTRECPTILLTQNLSGLKNEITNNANIWVVFNQQIEAEAKIGATQLRLANHTLLFDLPKGHCWVRSPDVGPKLVHVKLPRFKLPPSYVFDPTPIPTEKPYERRTVITELPREPEDTPPGLPLPPLEVQEILGKIERTHGDCWLWTGSTDKDGYGVQRWTYHDDRPPNNRPAHQVVWELVYGRPWPKGMSYDHRRSCPRRCVNPAHAVDGPMTIGDNVRNMHRTRGHRVARTG
jgi:hypothetical protein